MKGRALRRLSELSGAAAARQLALLDAERVQAAWQVRESRRARRLTVRVFPGGNVEIVVPLGTRSRTVQQFVGRHRGWIERKVEEFRHTAHVAPDVLPELVRLQAVGRQLTVHYAVAPGVPRALQTGSELLVRGDLARAPLVRHALQRWLLHTAHAQLLPWLDAVALRHGLSFARAQVRRQRTRWGSCSRAGTISINACLLFQPPDVVRYLFSHELAHTVHLNHSRRFWRLVEKLEPDWHALDRELSRGWHHVPHWAIG
jgi:predicted metal-dependent hydrolase